MAFFLSPFGNNQAFDANGNPLVGGSWRTFLAGTSTAQTTYTSQAGTTPQGTTMTLNALGLPENGPVWQEGGIALKFRLFDAAGVLMEEWDNISGIGDTVTSVDEWQPSGLEPTYISPTSFSLAGDQTTQFQVLRKLKSVNTGGTVYSRIESAVFGAGVSTITVTNLSGVLDSGLATVAYGFLSATNPSIPEGAFGATLRVTNTQATARTALGVGSPFTVRQTIVSGPVDANGQSAFVGATGSATVTATATLIASAANGFATTGPVDRVGSIVNPAWTGLSTNGTMYLWLDISVAGVCTTGSGTRAPVYQNGGTYSVTANQFTFNISEMVGKVGNGAAAVQTFRVYVGEVTVAGAVVTAITWYAMNRRFTGAWVATLPTLSVQVSANHNLGTQEFIGQFEAECTTNDNGFVVGDRIDLLSHGVSGTNTWAIAVRKGRLSMSISTMNGSVAPFGMAPAGGGVSIFLTNASWKYRFVCLPKF